MQTFRMYNSTGTKLHIPLRSYINSIREGPNYRYYAFKTCTTAPSNILMPKLANLAHRNLKRSLKNTSHCS